jgi:hypothetical protein
MATIPSINIASRTAPNWLKEAQESLMLSANPGGMMGALQSAKNPGSIKSFLNKSLNNAMGFALISQSTLEGSISLASQMAEKAFQKRIAERMAAAQAQSQQQKNWTPPKGLDPIIYFKDGTTLDTTQNLLTFPDGKQIDTKTGKEYVDELSLIRLANGSYVDTKNNVLHLANGTKIDTVTHLVIA